MKYTRENLKELAQQRYRKGMIIDQTIAYGGGGGKACRLRNDEISVHSDYGYLNVAYGGYGVFNTKTSIWAPIIKFEGNYEIY